MTVTLRTVLAVAALVAAADLSLMERVMHCKAAAAADAVEAHAGRRRLQVASVRV